MGPIQYTYIDCIVNYSIMCIWKELMLWWFIPCENWVKLMWVCWLDLDTSMGVSATCGLCRNVPMCLRNLQNVGAWGPNGSWDIVLPTSPYICWSHPRFWALALCPWICQHLPSGLEMFLCFSGTSKKFGAWGSNRSSDIDLFPPPCIFSTWHGFWVQVVCPHVCQHLPSDL